MENFKDHKDYPQFNWKIYIIVSSSFSIFMYPAFPK